MKWQNRPLEFNRQSTVPNFRHCALACVDSWPAPSLLLLLLFLLLCCFPERRASSPLYPTTLCSFADSALSHMCASDTMLWLEGVFFLGNIFSPVCVCLEHSVRWLIMRCQRREGCSCMWRREEAVVVAEGSRKDGAVKDTTTGFFFFFLATLVASLVLLAKTTPLATASCVVCRHYVCAVGST